MEKYPDVADEAPIWSATPGLKLLDFIDYKTNITVVDIGSGTGFPLTEIALRLGEGSFVYGIDPWKEAIQRVNKKLEYYDLRNVQMIEGIAESIPLEADTVDLITSNNGMNNVGDMETSLSECARIIKRGGQFVQTMNTDQTMMEFYGPLSQVLSELKMGQEMEMMREHISQKRPPVDRTVEMIKKHGFEIRNLEHDQFCYRFASGTAMFNHYFIRLAFMDSWIKLLPADRTEEVFDIIENRLNKQSREAGGLTLSVPYVLINAIRL